MDEGDLPRRGRACPAAAALEQDRAGPALAFAYGAGDRGLRHAQGPSGRGETAGAVDGEQQPQVLRAQRP